MRLVERIRQLTGKLNEQMDGIHGSNVSTVRHDCLVNFDWQGCNIISGKAI